MNDLTYNKYKKIFTILISVFTGLIHIANFTIYTLPSIKFFAIHLMLGLALIFLHYETKNIGFTNNKFLCRIIDWILIALSFITGLYIIINFDFYTQVMQTSVLTYQVLFFGIIVVGLVLIASIKVLGYILPSIATIMIIYAIFGNNISGIMGHKGYSFMRVVATVYSDLGVYGTPIAVSATNVFLFVLFAALLGATGADEIFRDLAIALAGKKRGGPAKMAVIASTFFGTLSGSCVANVVSTGAFTIPLMKKEGYPKKFAGAVEAVASTGGQIMPPIMGAAAFVLADIAGLPYTTVCLAALLPALMYYTVLIKMVDLEAIKRSFSGMPEDKIPNAKKVAKKGMKLFIPVIVLLFQLFIMKETPMKSAIWAILAIIICGFLDKRNRLTLAKLAYGFRSAGKSITQVVAACATSGIVIGMFALTGLGLKFSSTIVALGRDNILLSLLLAMFVCIILGMGLPTTAAYIICATAIAPALIKIGIEPLAAHLFLLYFACISAITPPVAVASYAASGIAEEDSMSVSLEAVKLGIAGFVLPFTFTYNSQFVSFGFNLTTLVTWVSGFIFCYSVAYAIQGYVNTNVKTSVIERIAFLSIAIFMLKANLISLTVGGIMFLLLVKGRKILKKKNY
ncbi:TRAP transporter permease [Vallitalea guaymasensis]|uniref:TRAP transporter fused permease subunit n=1 Tax=Vallitalea guaymasensis TaxID=1185412 RepID=A0A8J8MAB8_9FIRM|nr:TRAP transporter fused permease subunit [Vallitalea guaymasensis]QUH29238.1 TRAP transporter fused permease subunit [Vallitalea guaymasensis]